MAVSCLVLILEFILSLRAVDHGERAIRRDENSSEAHKVNTTK